MTRPGQTLQLGSGGFYPCTSHVDVSLSIHMSHAMHICVFHGCAMPCRACAQCFGDGVTRLAPASGFGYSIIPCRRVSPEQWEQMQLGVPVCVLRAYLPCETLWILDQK